MGSESPLKAVAPAQPGWTFRAASTVTLGLAAAACRGFMFGLQSTEIHGLDGFLSRLDERRQPERRQRGLITVSNHLSILDDPLMWGALPLRYASSADNMRWSLGSYDLLFRNKLLSSFFTFGQVLPTHRTRFSSHGGLFQATMTQAIRLLSDPSANSPLAQGNESSASKNPQESSSLDVVDPFSSALLTYSTTGLDTFPAPSAYASRKHAWIHIFPEGRIHQHPDYMMRYFKWGVARLILEADECPDIIPIWIEGCDQVMHETRTFPRFIPRAGKRVGIWFGENVGGSHESVFAELRRQWQVLVRKDEQKRKALAPLAIGELSDELKYSQEAIELRKECTMAVRRAVLDLRRRRGLPDEDPKASLVDTWVQEGSSKEMQKRDGSWVREE